MNHKVAYILVSGTPESPGLHRTLESKISELSHVLPGSQALCFLPRGAKVPVNSPNIDFQGTNIWPKQLLHLIYPRLVSKWIRSQEVQGASPDTIIIRSVVPSPLMSLYFRKKNFTLLTDHHTKTATELSLLSHLPLWLVSGLLRVFRFFSDGVTDGKIVVTHEIAESESFKGPIHVLGNPLSHEPQLRQRLTNYDGQEIRLVMPVSQNFPWHGIERLIASAQEWLNENDALTVHIDIVGEGVAESIEKEDRLTVCRTPQLTANQLTKRMHLAHLGVSSLALYRKGMRDACPLKSRLFISLGIPFIYAYNDPDLVDENMIGLALVNKGSLIPLKLVSAYLDKIYSDQDAYFDEVKMTQKNLTAGRKMRSLANFIDACSQSANRKF